MAITQPEQLTQRKSKTVDRGLGVHRVVRLLKSMLSLQVIVASNIVLDCNGHRIVDLIAIGIDFNVCVWFKDQFARVASVADVFQINGLVPWLFRRRINPRILDPVAVTQRAIANRFDTRRCNVLESLNELMLYAPVRNGERAIKISLKFNDSPICGFEPLVLDVKSKRKSCAGCHQKYIRQRETS